MAKIVDTKLLSVSFHNNLVARYCINNSWCQTVTNTALFAGWKTHAYICYACLLRKLAQSGVARSHLATANYTRGSGPLQSSPRNAPTVPADAPAMCTSFPTLPRGIDES